jgi:hypothetical protein
LLAEYREVLGTPTHPEMKIRGQQRRSREERRGEEDRGDQGRGVSDVKRKESHIN